MLRTSLRAGVQVVGLVGVLVLSSAAHAYAGPQDDPPPVADQPPVQVVTGNAALEDDTVTLTLKSAGEEGGLEKSQIDAAMKAAAAIQQAAATTAPSYSVGDSGTSVPSSSDAGQAGSDTGECGFRAAVVPAGDARWGGNDPAAGTLLVNPCNGGGQYLYVPNAAPDAAGAAVVPPPPPDPLVLAQQAYGELTVPKPVVQRSPDESNSDPSNGGLPYTWVGLHTWVWVPEWQPLQRTVALRGVSATVTATPTVLVFDPGNGDVPVTCPGPGRPWTEADGNDAPTGGGCGYVYRAVTPSGPLTATTSIRWSVAWTSNTGAGGVFPELTTSSVSSFLVEQIQVVVR